MASEEQTPFVAATETDLLHRLVELNPGYLWATDRELRYTALFGRRLHENGWKPEEMYGRRVTEFAGGVPQIAIDAHERALRGESVSYEFELNERFWRGRVVPLTAEDGTIVGVAGTSLDVTELIHTGHELDESRAKLALALAQVRAIIWATDAKLCLSSAAGRPIRGRSVEAWIGQPLDELLGDRNHPAVACHEQALEGTPGRFDIVIDGREYEASVDPLHNAQGEIVGTVGIAIDVAGRRSERRTLEWIAHLVAHATDAICGLDRDGRIFCWNDAAERMYGWTAEEMLGATTDRIVPPEERREWELTRARVLAGETTEQLAATRIRKDGTPIRIWLIRTPILDEDGEVVGFSTIARDLARREEADERRQNALKLEAVARLAGGIAQDFNNLLTAIAGNAELAMPHVTAEPGREALESIVAAAQRAGALTHGLLGFSQRRVLQPQTFDLNDSVTATQPLLERIVGGAVTVVLDLAQDLAPVSLDPAALRQILFDLALNADEAMPSGGTLTVATAAADEHAILRVTDTGVGMDADTRRRAFDPFFSTKEPASGSGLGLAAVHGTVLQSGGQLSLESTPGGGTTIELQLPYAGAGRPDEPDTANGSSRILLIEDEELVRRLVIHTLEGEGHTVVALESPLDALARVEAGEEFDLLLTDLVMPSLYGDELVARVRELRPDLPAIVMSGYVSDPDAFPPSVVFLPKPFRPSELIDVVARALVR